MQKSLLKDFSFLISLAICSCAAVFLTNPTLYMKSIENGLVTWTTSVVPSLFPFFVMSKLLVELNFFSKFNKITSPLTKKLFKAPAVSGYIFMISVASGYPVGAKTIEEYYKKGFLTQTQCKKAAVFTSTAGPVFLLGTVGGKFFGSTDFGVWLLICNVLSAIICGILFRSFFRDESEAEVAAQLTDKDKNVLNEVIYSSVIGILNVGAFICLFFLLTDMIFSTPFVQSILSIITPSASEEAKAFLTGIFEVTRGCKMISQTSLPLGTSFILCSALVSFSGLCICLQSFSYLKNCKIRFSFLIFVKLVQAAAAALIAAAICCFVKF